MNIGKKIIHFLLSAVVTLKPASESVLSYEYLHRAGPKEIVFGL